MNYIRTKISGLHIESWTKHTMTLGTRNEKVHLDFSDIKVETTCGCGVDYYCFHILFALQKLNLSNTSHTKSIREYLNGLGDCKQYSMTNSECCVCLCVLKKKCISCMTCQKGVHEHCWDKFNRLNDRCSLLQKKCFYCLSVRLVRIQGVC